jgi:hypothetical protein
MPWLPMYLVMEDTPSLLALLNRDRELAFLISDGPGQWIARNELSALTDGRTALWHVSSGPLPLLGVRLKDPVKPIEDPWLGWIERRQGANSSVPCFGAGHPGVIWLNLRITARETGSICGLSSFEWIGSRYALIGSAATPQTERWWRTLRTHIRKITQRVPRVRLDSSTPSEVYAFPTAYDELKAGGSADMNP